MFKMIINAYSIAISLYFMKKYMNKPFKCVYIYIYFIFCYYLCVFKCLNPKKMMVENTIYPSIQYIRAAWNR